MVLLVSLYLADSKREGGRQKVQFFHWGPFRGNMDNKPLENYYQVWESIKDKSENDLYGYPDTWPEFHNANSDACDMLIGPCACGAWHKAKDWKPDSTFAERLGVK